MEARRSDRRSQRRADRRRLHHHSARAPRFRPHARNQRPETLNDRTTMSTTSSPPPPETPASGLRDAAIGTLFAFVLLVPRLLHLRRNAKSWMLFRILLGAAGAALVGLPLGFQN